MDTIHVVGLVGMQKQICIECIWRFDLIIWFGIEIDILLELWHMAYRLLEFIISI